MGADGTLSASLTTEKVTNKKAGFFSGVSTPIPLMFLGHLYSFCMYPGKQQVRYLNGERFKNYGYWYFPLILEVFSPNCTSHSRSYTERAVKISIVSLCFCNV